ncbi:ATP-dependent DNA helicase PIF1-like [Aphis craccivora]|uniref:ATP-dependent DNA helicase PIF1-like n=1 Tax=Aphis craccivora TaxID=307492 RepID=A0A6G0Z7M0_APHCR|nr:ATP-dependent DNA helicase PIF1-like [Aphis craccivora]
MVVECELVVAGQLFLVFIDVFLYGELLQVKAPHKNIINVIEAFVITGCARGDIVIIPRKTLIQTDYPFEFKIIQFPLKVCFAMTINKSKGQSLSMAGIVLREECFSHGQFSAEVTFARAMPGGTANINFDSSSIKEFTPEEAVQNVKLKCMDNLTQIKKSFVILLCGLLKIKYLRILDFGKKIEN